MKVHRMEYVVEMSDISLFLSITIAPSQLPQVVALEALPTIASPARALETF